MMRKMWVAFIFTVLATFGFAADTLMYRDAFNSTYTDVIGVWTNASGVYSTTKTVTGSGWINIQYNYNNGAARSEDNGKSFSGAGTYTLSYNTNTKVFTVTSNKSVSSVSVTGNGTVYTGGTLQLGKTVYWSDSTTTTSDTTAWTSSNTAVATVNATSGLVTAVAAGTSTITATVGGKSGTVTVTVTPVLASTVAVSGAASVYAGATTQLAYNVTFNNGSTSASTSVTWASSDAAVAIVSASGVVTAVAPGTATITATKDGVSGSQAVTVNAVVASTVSVTGTTALFTGSTSQLAYSVVFNSGATSTTTPVTWNSSDAAVVTVDANGLVTAVAQGTAVVTCTKDGVTASKTFTITDIVPSGITVAGTTALFTGSSSQLTYTVTYNNGAVSTATPVVWTSSDPTVVTVSASGLVTAVAGGTADVTVAKDAFTAAKTFVITNIVPTSVTVNSGSSSVMIGGAVQFTYSIAYNNSTTSTTNPVAWASSDEGVATVDANGLVTSVSAGTATITASSGSVAGTKTITVVAPESVVISGEASTMVATTLQLGYTVTYTDASTSTTTPVTWASSNPLVATVDANGLVTALTAGTTTISSTKGNVSGAKVITVVDVASVAVSGTPTVIAGQTIQLSYIVTFTDGTTSTTTPVTWASSDETVAIATVTATGTVQGIAPGIATIFITKNGVTGTASVTVNPVVVDTVLITGNASAIAGGTIQLGCTLTYNTGATSTTTPVTWTTSDANVATVDANGLVTTIAAGSATITATKDGVSDTQVITVSAVAATAITLAGSTAVTIPATTQLTYSVTFNNGTTSTTTPVTWTSSNTSLATVSSTGVVTAVAAGTVTITATKDTVSATKTITVSNGDQWYYRGTTNSWGSTAMTLIAANTWEFIADFTNDTGTAGTSTGPRFKISHLISAWTEAYPSTDYLIPAKKQYRIVFNSSTRTVTSVTEYIGVVTATSIALSGSSSVVAGSTLQLGYTVSYNNSTTSTTTPVAFTSSDVTKATVSSTGLVTAVAPGTVTITCIKDSLSTTKSVTVTAPVVVSSVAVTGNASAFTGGTIQMSYTVTYSDATTSTTTPVTWTSSNTSVATVSSTGLVTAVTDGAVTITATKDTAAGSKSITINAVAPSAVTISGTASANVGATTQLGYTVTYNNGTTSTTDSVVWSSTNSAIATVDQTGKVTGVAAGTVTINCAKGGITGSKSVTINAVVTDAWYFSGTANAWAASPMTNVGTNKWEYIADFTADGSGTAGTATGPRFKIRHSPTDWVEAYGKTGTTTDYLIPAKKKYIISFNSSEKRITNIAEYGVTPAFNGTMYQGFSWDLHTNEDRRIYNLWQEYQNTAAYLAGIGITAIWVPSPAKASFEANYPNGNYKTAGGNFNGYAVYDRYDLGEFAQGSSSQNGNNPRTKWGTKQEFKNAVTTFHSVGIQVYTETIFNHNIGGEDFEYPQAETVQNWNDTTKTPGKREIGNGDWKQIKLDSIYNYPARNNAYSSFKFNKSHFRGTDTNADIPGDYSKIYRLQGKSWSANDDVGYEAGYCGNFDYLMGIDIDHSNAEVKQFLKDWGEWMINETGIDGFRLDAIKHYSWTFQKEWITYLRAKFPTKELFTVGEYWEDYGTSNTSAYLTKTAGTINVFDFPLGRKFRDASWNFGTNRTNPFDMTTMFADTVVNMSPIKAVTFVENHDVEYFRNKEEWSTERNNMTGGNPGTKDWFKPQAYAMILLRQGGYPCVYYGDLNGTDGIASQKTAIEKLLDIRKKYAYGTQYDYVTAAQGGNPDYIGWTRLGDATHSQAMAVVVSDGNPGSLYMDTGKPSTKFIDVTGNYGSEPIWTDASGKGTFKCSGKSYSVWVSQ